MIEMNLSRQARRIRRIALGDFLYRSARKFGERTALVDGDQRISYAELDARSSRFAHYLLSTLGTGKQVGMLCANSIDMVVACNGIHKAGQVWVPVNIKQDAAAIGYILQHAEVSAVVVDHEMLGLPGLPELLQKKSYDRIIVCGPEIMMRGIAALAEKAHIPCQVSLEKRMACGLGACLSCSIDTNDGQRKKVCKDGPVFWAKEVF